MVTHPAPGDRRRRQSLWRRALLHVPSAIVTGVALLLLSWILNIPEMLRKIDQIHEYEQREIKEKVEQNLLNNERMRRIEDKLDRHMGAVPHNHQGEAFH